MDFADLESIGLTPAQIKVYVALLRLGETTTGPLIEQSGLQNSVVYRALDQLIKHGLATFVLKGKRKHFCASNPDHLIDFIDEKKERVEQLIPGLKAEQAYSQSPQEARVFLGWKGVYGAFNRILDELPVGGEYIAFGAGFESQYSEEATKFFREYQKRRAQKKYSIRIIVNESSRKQVSEYPWYPSFGRPTFRFVPGFAPVGLVVFGDHVLNVAFGTVPVAVIITSKEIAASYRNCFLNMWKIARP